MSTAHESLSRARKAECIANVTAVIHAGMETSLPASEWLRNVTTETEDVIAAVVRRIYPEHARMDEPSDACWTEAAEMLERREVAIELLGDAVRGGARAVGVNGVTSLHGRPGMSSPACVQ